MKKLNALLLIIVLAGTIGLFFLLGQEEKTPLFYFNLGFTCLLIIVFFTVIIKISGERLFSVPNIAVGLQIKRFVLFSALIMIAFNIPYALLGKEFIDPKWYFAALILLTIIYTIIIIFTTQGAAYQKKQNNDIFEKTKQRVDLKSEQTKLSNSFRRIISNTDFKDFQALEETKKAISSLGDKVGIIPVAKIERSPEDFEKVSLDLTDLLGTIKKLEDTSDENEYKKILKTISNQAHEIIDNINIIIKV